MTVSGIIAIAVAMSVLLVDAQIPPNFSPSSSNQLGVAYGPGSTNTRIITPGQQLYQSSETAVPPTLGLSSMPAVQGPYLVTMVDPDAPATSRQILHWLQPNVNLVASPSGLFPYTLTNSTPPVAAFANPMPGLGSGPHRYIQYLWKQPANFTIPAQFSNYSSTNRARFDIAAFAAAAGLGSPLAANYFLTANQNETTAANSSSTTTVVLTSTISTSRLTTSVPVTSASSASKQTTTVAPVSGTSVSRSVTPVPVTATSSAATHTTTAAPSVTPYKGAAVKLGSPEGAGMFVVMVALGALLL